MASRDDVPAAVASRLANDEQKIAFGVSLEFDSGTLNLWSGIGDFTGSDSLSYTGAGELLDIQNVEEDNELSSTNMTISISGLSANIVTYATTEDYQNRPVTIKMFFFHPDTDDEVGNVILFKGRMDTLTVTDGDSFSVVISAENKLIDLTRPKNLFYTAETQNFLYSGDKGLEFVSKIREQTVNWGSLTSWGGNGGNIGDDRGTPSPEY
tara:strand:+ start:4287 stop:4916 length:630 start_codon:yes stop_codon:yes gene_type:complete